MKANHYKVLFEGHILDDHDEADVRERLGKRFKADDARINRLFSGKSYAIGKNLSEKGARRYEKIIMQAGGLCRIVSMDGCTELDPAKPDKTEGPLFADINQRISTVSSQPFRLTRRIGRCQYISLCWLVLGIETIAFLMPAYLPRLTGSTFTIQQITSIGLGIHALAILVAVYAMISRLHDMNRDGSLWLFIVIPIINLMFMIWLVFGKGSKGDNAYGSQSAIPGQFVKLLGLYIPLVILLGASGGAWVYQNELLALVQQLPAEWSKDIPAGIEFRLPFLSS